MLKRTYKKFTHKEAAFRICCEKFDAITAEIINQRNILEEYIQRFGEFQKTLKPIELTEGAPDVALRMANAADLVGTGPMAAVAGIMAELAAQAGIAAGATEAIVENGGDIYIQTTNPLIMELFPGDNKLAGKLAFSIEPDETPLAICSSSGKMGHSMSMGNCDLATVVSKDTALADAAATQAANLVKTVDDVDAALNRIVKIKGITGVLIVKDEKIGLAGKLPKLIKIKN
jgi:uncharacterized protein